MALLRRRRSRLHDLGVLLPEPSELPSAENAGVRGSPRIPEHPRVVPRLADEHRHHVRGRHHKRANGSDPQGADGRALSTALAHRGAESVTVAAHRFDNAKRRRPEHHARQAMLTPDYVLEPVRALLGGIGLDPCTEPDNPTRADRFYCLPADGAALPWDAPIASSATRPMARRAGAGSTAASRLGERCASSC
jgi:hypothetical protein